jgi:cell division protein FtsW (lipid II flippase)
MLGAGVITSALIVWLFVVLLTVTPATRVRLLSFHLLQAWLVGIWVVTMLVQIFLTCMGSLGAFVLTGVPLPLLAMGNASLTVSAFFVALATNELGA